MNAHEKTLIKIVYAALACVPVFGGVMGILNGPGMGSAAHAGLYDPFLESHYRYLSGLLLGIGLAFWSCVPKIEYRRERIRLLTFIVVIGGAARLASAVAFGQHFDGMMTFTLFMELAATPLMCVWQRRVALDSPHHAV